MNDDRRLRNREAAVEMSPEAFRAAGHALVDRIADFLDGLPARPVAPGEKLETVRQALGQRPLPQEGQGAEQLLNEAVDLLFNHSTFNGHPRFMGYITSSAAPIGALGDLLAAAVNPNVGGWTLAPMATEIEVQTIRWIAELVGYPADCGGVLVSGGNVANFTAFLVARAAKAGASVRQDGLRAGPQHLVYASEETHTWIQKAADLFGLGTKAIRWLPTDKDQRLDLEALQQQLAADRAAGGQPFLVVGTAGTVSTGAVDPLAEMADFCQEHDLWFHVDGAYGAPAAVLLGDTDRRSVLTADERVQFQALARADSLALDPHKWLYAPLEAGCTLVRDPRAMTAAFSYRPDYYRFEEEDVGDVPVNLYEYSLQNSRGFRALKVWMGLRQAGRSGLARLIEEDISLAATLYRLVSDHPGLEAVTHHLSITTFRYVPVDLQPGNEAVESYLNELNAALVDELQDGGRVFVSNAVIGGRFLLRACVVNFRTTLADIAVLPEIVVECGRALDAEMRPQQLA